MRRLLAAAALAALLAGCTANDSVESSSAASGGASAASSAAGSGASSAAGASSALSSVPAELKAAGAAVKGSSSTTTSAAAGPLNVGDRATVSGETVEVCAVGDGYGVSYIGTTPGASCDTAIAKGNAALIDEQPSKPIQWDTPKQVSVTDQVTMACSSLPGAGVAAVCTVPNEAPVSLWSN